MKKVFFRGEELSVEVLEYTNGGNALRLVDAEGCPYAVATVWLEGLGNDEVAVKDYSENVGMLESLLEGDVVYFPHRLISSGFVEIPVCRLK